MYLAHRAEDGREQSIPEHAKSVSDLCAKFAAPQTIPLPYLLPCVRAIAELAVNYGASCVLCTATQPALGPMFTAIAPEHRRAVQPGGEAERRREPRPHLPPDSAYTATLPHSMKRPLEVMRSVTRDRPAMDNPGTVESYFTAMHRFAGEEIDSKHIVSLLENGVQDPGRPTFPFAQVTKDFRLIDQNTYAVLIPRTQDAEAIAARLQNGERTRALLRKAGQYSVNVYKNRLDALLGRGVVDMVEEDLYIPTPQDTAFLHL